MFNVTCIVPMAEGLLYISRGKRTPVIDKSSWNEGDDIRSYLPGKEEGKGRWIYGSRI